MAVVRTPSTHPQRGTRAPPSSNLHVTISQQFAKLIELTVICKKNKSRGPVFISGLRNQNFFSPKQHQETVRDIYFHNLCSSSLEEPNSSKTKSSTTGKVTA